MIFKKFNEEFVELQKVQRAWTVPPISLCSGVSRLPQGAPHLLSTEGTSSGQDAWFRVLPARGSPSGPRPYREALKNTPGEPAFDEPEGEVHFVCLCSQSVRWVLICWLLDRARTSLNPFAVLVLSKVFWGLCESAWCLVYLESSLAFTHLFLGRGGREREDSHV